MEDRVAVISIIVEKGEAVAALNALLHDCGRYIIGRLGLPYRRKGVNIICVAVDAPGDRIDAIADALDRLEGVSARATLVGA